MSTVKADNFTWKTGQATGQTGTNVTGDQIVYGVAKSWINYNGTGSTINKSFNVSSVTKSATAKYNIFFTTSFADAYYSFAGTATPAVDSDASAGVRFLSPGSGYHSYIGRTVGDIKTICAYDSANITDSSNLNATFDR